MAVNSIAFLNMIESRMARPFMCLLMSEAIEAIVKVKRKNDCNFFKDCAMAMWIVMVFLYAWYRYYASEQISDIFQANSPKLKDDVNHKLDKHVYHATLSIVFKHVVIVDRHEPFAKRHCDYNNSSKSAHFSVFCGFIKLKVLNLRLFHQSQNLRLHFSTF